MQPKKNRNQKNRKPKKMQTQKNANSKKCSLKKMQLCLMYKFSILHRIGHRPPDLVICKIFKKAANTSTSVERVPFGGVWGILPISAKVHHQSYLKLHVTYYCFINEG